MPNTQTTDVDEIAIIEQLRTLGGNLRAQRNKLKLTQAQVAKQAEKLDRGGISKIECGERAPNFDTFKRLCGVLGTTQEHLLRNIGPAKSARRRLSRKERTSSSPAEIFGANLKWARDREGLSQEKLALEAGVDFTTISRFENGHDVPNTRTVLKLARKLKTSPGALLHGM